MSEADRKGTAIAVAGLGAMGQRVARRLLSLGYEVHVWSRNRDSVGALADAGAHAVDTPADAVARTAALITFVTDGSALRDIMVGRDGSASGNRPITLLQMGTVSPADLADVAAMLPQGSALLDVPVLGSIAEAETGRLRILAGADPRTYAMWRSLLEDLGTPRLLGPPGAGTAAKLVANSAVLGVVGLLGESLRLASALGLEREAAFATLAATPLAEQAERRRDSIIHQRYPRRFGLSLARKDADLILHASSAAGVRLRLAQAMREWLSDAESAGLGDHDYTAVLSGILGEPPAF